MRALRTSTNGNFRVVRADHTAFVVADLDQAVKFWIEALGAVPVRTTHLGRNFLARVTGAKSAEARTAILEIPGHRIELLEYQGAIAEDIPPRRPFQPGAAHIALKVDDLAAAIERVAEFGWHAVEYPQTIPTGPRAGTLVSYVVGPDGTTIEFMQSPD
jgi:catechol 2,3-dioxygenase-like lactoylglutathione lyase family enzyme